MSHYSPDELYAWCVAHEWFELSEIDCDLHFQKARIEVNMALNRISTDKRWV